MPYKFTAGRRPRDRGRVGQEPPADAGDLPRRPRRARAADPARPDAARVPRLRAAQGGRGSLDFEDLLVTAIGLYERDRDALGVVQARYRAFTVDEYQDVNLLQQTLLELWLGERDDLCAVGDDYQAIYAFTGATPRAPARAARAAIRTRPSSGSRTNYRSTPEVLALANRLVPRLGGAEKTLRAAREARAGARRTAVRDARSGARLRRRARSRAPCRRRRARGDGDPLPHERALGRLRAGAGRGAKIPFQGAALLGARAARQLLMRSRGAARRHARETCASSPRSTGCSPPRRSGSASARRRARKTSTLLVRLAEFDDAEDGRGRVRRADLERAVLERRRRRRAPAHLPPREGARVRRGVPPAPRRPRAALASRAKTDEEIAEERRLFYVGLTRARAAPDAVRGRRSRAGSCASSAVERGPAVEPPDDPLLDSLKRWRLERAKEEGVPRSSSSTTRRSPRSPPASRGAWPSSAASRASARRSSSATATTCSPPSPPGPKPRRRSRQRRTAPGP